jgi:AAA domain/SAM domain (Sterile alpha motif)
MEEEHPSKRQRRDRAGERKSVRRVHFERITDALQVFTMSSTSMVDKLHGTLSSGASSLSSHSTPSLSSHISHISNPSNQKHAENKSASSGPPPVHSRAEVNRADKYAKNFEELLRLELAEATAQVCSRVERYDGAELERRGHAAVGLDAELGPLFWGERIVAFSKHDRSGFGPLVRRLFTHGEMVLLTRADESTVYEGVVMDCGARQMRVVARRPPFDVHVGRWRLDRCTNRVTHDRQMAALQRISSLGASPPPLRDLIVADGPIDADGNRSTPSAELIGDAERLLDRADVALNRSQRDAVMLALRRRVSLVHGPPGTGKTRTTIELVNVLRRHAGGPILVTANTNVAVDNLLEGLLARGIDAVRIGAPVRVRACNKLHTIEAKMAQRDEGSVNNEYGRLMRRVDLIAKELGALDRADGACVPLRRRLKEATAQLRGAERAVSRQIITSAEAVCATCCGAGHGMLSDVEFPIAIIDEATQATEPSALVPIVRGARQLIMFGDHHQLEPTVLSDAATRGGLSRSLFSRLLDRGVKSSLLDVQYRMHPAIASFPSMRFYDGKILNGVTAEQRMPPRTAFQWADESRPITFIDVAPQRGGNEAQVGTTLENGREAQTVLHIVSNLLQSSSSSPSSSSAVLRAKDIGVVAPYSGQVQLLRKMFDRHDLQRGVDVASIDGFQGREKEIIVFSTVRSNAHRNIGFLADWRRLNVAITRARCGLVVVGDSSTLLSDKMWSDWLGWLAELHGSNVQRQQQQHHQVPQQQQQQQRRQSPMRFEGARLPTGEQAPFTVAAWLESIGLGEHADAFRQAKCTGQQHLSALAKEHLRAMGIAKMAHRARILIAIEYIEKSI